MHFNIFRKESDKKTANVNLIVMAIFSFFALLAAFQLSVDKVHLLEQPNAKLPCSINVVLNCASVMKTPQASLLGFPNSFLGIIGFSIFLFFAISSLMGAKYTKNVIKLLLAGILGAWIFALWLFFDSLYVIQILCPWCLLTTLSTTIVLATLLRISLMDNIFNIKKKHLNNLRSLLRKDYDRLFFASVLVALVILIVAQFGDALIS
ncbi:MAG: vitamin K epoxide reductase family protein [Candidatus Saccharibacteria bacterium]|nr:vitamin K epoxide reductase family protein [Candidatus Saccharibacteria bacterium]